MWFDPTVIAQSSQSLATLATFATLGPKTGDDASKVAEVAEVATPLYPECETSSYRWLIHFSDRKPLTVDFSPPTTHTKVLASYPDALAAEPIEVSRRQPTTMLTGKQDTAVVAWLAQIGESDEAIAGDMLAQCRHDEDARQYFVGRAGESATSGIDNRRRC